jgi:hypothetical protein
MKYRVDGCELHGVVLVIFGAVCIWRDRAGHKRVMMCELDGRTGLTVRGMTL